MGGRLVEVPPPHPAPPARPTPVYTCVITASSGHQVLARRSVRFVFPELLETKDPHQKKNMDLVVFFLFVFVLFFTFYFLFSLCPFLWLSRTNGASRSRVIFLPSLLNLPSGRNITTDE